MINILYIRIMSRKAALGILGKLHFISFAVVYWIDLFVRNDTERF